MLTAREFLFHLVVNFFNSQYIRYSEASLPYVTEAGDHHILHHVIDHRIFSDQETESPTIHAETFIGIVERAKKYLNTFAPATKKRTITETRTASKRESTRILVVNFFFQTAIRKMSVAPTPAASVGVNKPV